MRTAVIVAALELEAVAAREHLRDVVEEVHQNGTVYFVGQFGMDDPWRVAIVIAGAGNPTAALELERAVQWFGPHVVMLVGVAGGIKDVDLGDVVAADKVYGYERGKVQAEFLPRADVWRSTYPAVQRARAEAAKAEWQGRILGPPPIAMPRAFVAPIAAGEKVVAAHDSDVFAFLRRSFSDAIAVEMEGAGFLAAAYANIGVDALVVRGISDLVEGKATADASGGQLRAARHAAAFAFQVLLGIQRDGKSTERRNSDRQLDREGRPDEFVRPEGGDTLFDSALLDGVASATAANTAALERIENVLNAGSSSLAAALPREFVDAEAERRLTRLRKTRFLVGGAPGEQASRLAQDLVAGDLQIASPTCKARALAWCARILFDWPSLGSARDLVRTASSWARTDEVSIAEAFGRFHDGDLSGALVQLSQIDSPIARAAAFIIVRKAKGPREALLWLTQSGLGLGQVDSDGKLFVISAQLDDRQVDGALHSSSTLQADDFEQTPALEFVAANAHFASVVPAELALSVLSQPAASLTSLPLADGATALERRRAAMRLFQQASRTASEIGCPSAASEASDRAVLLGISDPQHLATAMTELQASMRSPDDSVRRLPIALAAGVKIDLEAAELEIDRQSTLSGGGTEHTALARLAIAKEKPAGECAQYLRTHREELTKHLNAAFLTGIEIAALVAAGQLPTAEERLQEALQKGVSPEEHGRLQSLIADARESDPISTRERRFLETDQLGDLMLLITALEGGHDWTRLSQYGAILFERMRDSGSCTVYAQSLFRLGEFTRLIEFLGKHEELVVASDRLQSFLAWALYGVGDVRQCRTVLTRLRSIRDEAQDRDLLVNLEITSGNWSALAVFVEQEWEHRDAREARSLLRAGILAYSLGSGRARALVAEAAEKGPDDPDLLVGCYSAAMRGGWEDEATFKWLERAAALSGPEGPVQKVSLKDLVDRTPGWQHRETQAWDQLTRGLIPLYGFGKILNRSLAEVSLLPALGNADSTDPRRRTPIYAYSGARHPNAGLPQSAAVDPLALLNFGLLDLLEEFCAAVGKVVIPHGTLAWLFEEAQRIRVSQPSRVADAHEIKRLLSSKVLQCVEATAVVDEELAREVGRDLASLFAEVEADWGADQRPRYVIRPQPIHRLASLMEEEAELGSHASHLRGCLDVVDALVKRGRLTQAEEGRARAFLRMHERRSTEVSEIADNAVLYVDGVALSHLQHLRLLSKFESTGFTVLIPEDEVEGADGRIAYESLAARAAAHLDSIRDILRERIDTGKVALGPMPEMDGEESDNWLRHPALDIVRCTPFADVVVVDDRYLNRNATVTHDGITRPIRASYDFVTGLGLSEDEQAERIALLRNAGFAFVPVSSAEIAQLLGRARVSDGRVVETAELRLLRENLQSCRMTSGLQLPSESTWFDGLIRSLLEAIREQWKDGADLEVARARSDWLLVSLDLRGWAHRSELANVPGFSQSRFRAQLLVLSTFSAEVSEEVREAYWNWLSDTLLGPVEEQHGDLFRELVRDVAAVIIRMVDRHRARDLDVN